MHTPGKLIRKTLDFLPPENITEKKKVNKLKALPVEIEEQREKAKRGWKELGLPNPHDVNACPKGGILQKEHKEVQGGEKRKIRFKATVDVAIYSRHLNPIDVTLDGLEAGRKTQERIDAESGHKDLFTVNEAAEHFKSLMTGASNAWDQTTEVEGKRTAGRATEFLQQGLFALKEACADEAQKKWFSDLFNCYDPVLSACLDSKDTEFFDCVLTALGKVEQGDEPEEIERALLTALQTKCSKDFVQSLLDMKLNSFNCEGLSSEEIESAVGAFAHKYSLIGMMSKDPVFTGHHARQLVLHNKELLNARTEKGVADGLKTLRYKSQAGLHAEMMEIAMGLNSDIQEGEEVSGSLVQLLSMSLDDCRAIKSANDSTDETAIHAQLERLVRRSCKYEVEYDDARTAQGINSNQAVLYGICKAVQSYEKDGLSKKEMGSLMGDIFSKLQEYVASQIGTATDEVAHALLVTFNMYSSEFQEVCESGKVKDFVKILKTISQQCADDFSEAHYDGQLMQSMLVTTLNRYIEDESMSNGEKIERVLKETCLITRAAPKHFIGIISNMINNGSRDNLSALIRMAVEVQLNGPY